LALGVSKAPPGPARERSGVIVHIVGALHLADSKHTRSVESYSPISNGLTTVGGAKTRFLIGYIRIDVQRHRPTWYTGQGFKSKKCLGG